MNELKAHDEKLKILVIEDNEFDFFLIKKQFSKYDDTRYEFFWQPDTEEAHLQMINNAFDAYLIDYKLGIESGLEIFKKAKRMGFNRPTILMTGFNDIDLDKGVLSSGFDDYLIKSELSYFAIEKSIRYAIERTLFREQQLEQQIRVSNTARLTSLGEMAAGIAHEVNNPLAIVMASSALLRTQIDRNNLDDTFLNKMLLKIEANCNRVAKIIKTLKSFSANEEMAEMESVALYELIEHATELCLIKVKQTNVEFQREILPEDLPVECRPTEIVQVLVNLINNAVDAAKDTKDPWVKLKVEQEQGEISFSVLDSGEGVSTEDAEKLFKAFFSTKNKKEGTGLGLSIAKSIATSHGGNCWLDETSADTCFNLRFPIKQKCEEVSKKTIIIVEENPEYREVLQSICEETGSICISLSNKKDAWDYMSENHTDVLIMNYISQEGESIDLCEKVHSKYVESEKKPKIFLLTSTVDSQTANNFSKGLDVIFLKKPFLPSELLTAI